MFDSLGPFLVVVVVLSWVVLPVVVVIALAVGPRLLRPKPLLVRRCRNADPADPASRSCWVPVGEHCPRHGLAPQDVVREREPIIA